MLHEVNDGQAGLCHSTAYMFLGYVCVEADVLLCDVHVPLQKDALEQPAGIFGDDLFDLLKLEDGMDALGQGHGRGDGGG